MRLPCWQHLGACPDIDLSLCRHVAHEIGFPAPRASLLAHQPLLPKYVIESDHVTKVPQALKVAQLKQVCKALHLQVTGATCRVQSQRSAKRSTDAACGHSGSKPVLIARIFEGALAESQTAVWVLWRVRARLEAVPCRPAAQGAHQGRRAHRSGSAH